MAMIEISIPTSLIEEQLTMRHKLHEPAEIQGVELDAGGDLVAFMVYVEDDEVNKFNTDSWNQTVIEDFVEDILD